MDDIRTATAQTPGRTGPPFEGTALGRRPKPVQPKTDSQLTRQNVGQRPSIHRTPTVWDASQRPISPRRDCRRSCRACTLAPRTERTLEPTFVNRLMQSIHPKMCHGQLCHRFRLNPKRDRLQQ